MKKMWIVLVLLFGQRAIGQGDYWQQYLEFTINARLDDQEKTISGSETIVYKNNSPKTLDFIWFHLYPNAYRDSSTALFQQLLKDPSRKEKLKEYTPGFISDLAFTVNGVPAKTEPHPDTQYIDILKVLLSRPLLPGDSVIIFTPFKVQLPSYFSRSGYADGEFMACQWYPKPAVFDRDGWHEMPYLDMGEFFSEYASYRVNITLPADYVVGATGVLQTASEANAYKTIGTYNATHRDSRPELYQAVSNTPYKTLSYAADTVPDFAWFADKGFVIEYDTIQGTNGNVINAFTYYHNHRNTLWKSSIDFVKDAVHHYSDWVGPYGYPVVQAVEGPKNNSSGGMEYPMITLITSPDAKTETLDGVIAHEVGHNWFMSMLGTNERDHAWMDEGLNTYFQFRYEAEKYRDNSLFEGKIPNGIRELNESDFESAIYRQFLNIPTPEALETKSEDFDNSDDYSVTEYIKAAEWMHLLEGAIGRGAVDKAFQLYFKLWKDKHPGPKDMEAAFEQSTHKDMSKFFQLLYKKDKLVD